MRREGGYSVRKQRLLSDQVFHLDSNDFARIVMDQKLLIILGESWGDARPLPVDSPHKIRHRPQVFWPGVENQCILPLLKIFRLIHEEKEPILLESPLILGFEDLGLHQGRTDEPENAVNFSIRTIVRENRFIGTHALCG